MNLYGFVGNDGVNLYDVLGLKCGACGCPVHPDKFQTAEQYEAALKGTSSVKKLKFKIVIGATVAITKEVDEASCERKFEIGKCSRGFLGLGSCKCKVKAIITCNLRYKKGKEVIVSVSPKIGVGDLDLSLGGDIGELEFTTKEEFDGFERGQRVSEEVDNPECVEL